MTYRPLVKALMIAALLAGSTALYHAATAFVAWGGPIAALAFVGWCLALAFWIETRARRRH